jgi:uncharacterized protein (DUF1501 family)
MTDMKALFDQGNLAVLSNVGTLVEPTTKTAYQNDAVRVPRQLFAHNWQQEQWQFSTADAIEKFGWGGRVADALQAAGVNASAPVSMGISIAGANVFLTGRNVTPYAVSPWGARTLTTWGLGNGSEQAITKQAFADLLALQNNPAYAGQHAMQKAYADITQRAVTNSEIVDALLDKPSGVQTPIPENNWLASQLHMVARLIEYAQSDLLHNRQIFFVAIGGFDNHDGLVGNGTDPGPHDTRLAEVNGGLKFFWDALGDLGMRDQVTTFTASGLWAHLRVQRQRLGPRMGVGSVRIGRRAGQRRAALWDLSQPDGGRPRRHRQRALHSHHLGGRLFIRDGPVDGRAGIGDAHRTAEPDAIPRPNGRGDAFGDIELTP